MYPTVATTKLANIVANAQAVKSAVGARKVLAAVKANAYGHGSVPVATALAPVVDYLGVATVEEGVELRLAGVETPILKFSAPVDRDDVELSVRYGLTLAVTDVQQVRLASQVVSASDSLRLHLKVDTGMGRIGCSPQSAVSLAEAVSAGPGLVLEGVFSHLPVSDSPSGRDFTRKQIEVFAGVVTDIRESVSAVPIAHLANSGAVLAYPEAYFDMVRPGIMLYGSYPDPECPQAWPLLPALEWRTSVSFVKRVAAGTTIGYGRTWSAPTDRWIATIPVGYGDGFSRLLSNRGRALIGGVSYPIVGRVCMDQTMLDCGPAVDEISPVSVGDDVVLVGRSGTDEISVQELADQMGTIPYEVTCLITDRVRRAAI